MGYNNDLSVADIAAVTGNNNRGGWGGDWSSWIILFLIFGMFGWGGFGGFGGGFGGGMNGGVGAEVQRGFDHSTVVQKLDGITQGICDSTYALNNTIVNGFNGVERSICNVGYQTQAGFNQLGAQIASCCCETQRAIDGVNYNLATQSCDTRNLIQNTTRDIIDNANGNTRAILDFLTQDKIETLRAENQNLKLAASQANQNAVLKAAMDANTAEILRRSGYDCPTPAYIVQPPTPVSFNNCGTGYIGYNNGCGCNPCGCAA